jgi:endonuclease/exonuclease/phosphatase family metal-dependent hydrolase
MRQLCLVLSLAGVRVFGLALEPSLSAERVHRITGDPRRVEHIQRAPGEVDVVTWNIATGAAYDHVLAVLRNLNPDVVLLQEVDQDCRRTGFRNVARDLATALDLNWVAAGEFQEIGEGRSRVPAITGQAILSKFAIEDAAALPFAVQARWRWSLNPVQPRRGGRLALKARTGGILFYNTHIESGGNERLQQRQMAEIVADLKAEGRQGPLVVAGDLNNRPAARSLTVRSLTSASFVDALGDASDRPPTSLGQPHPIDWIFMRHVGASTGRVVDAPGASDHSPVISALRSYPAADVISVAPRASR